MEDVDIAETAGAKDAGVVVAADVVDDDGGSWNITCKFPKFACRARSAHAS